MSKSLMVQAIYRPKAGQEEALFALVKAHYPALKRAGLVTNDPPLVYVARGKRGTGSPYYVEIFSWKDENAPGLAHQLPEVMKIWEPMGPMIEGGPSPELAMLEPVTIDA